MELEGLVIDAHGRPVAGAAVWLDEETRTTSDAHGRFGFADKAPGRYWLRARKADLIAENAIATLYEGRGAIVLAVAPGIAMHVRVTAGGAPLAGARVTSSVETLAISDAGGLAVARGIGTDFQLFTVEADGYAAVNLSMWLAPDPGGTIERAVALERGAALGGVLIGPDGAPVRGGRVFVWGEAWGDEIIVGEDGTWRVPAVVADTYAINASTASYAVRPDVVIETDGETARTDVVVRVPRGRIVATVVDRSGAPVERPVVIARRTDVEHPDEVERTGEGGVVELDALSPAPYEIYAHDRDRGSAIAQVTVTGDEPARIELVVEPTAITGVVVDSSGAPVPGAEVTTRDAPLVCSDVTDREGRFRLDALPPGEYDVEAHRADHRDHQVSIVARCTAGDRDTMMVIPRGGTIRGRVLLDGVPVPRFGVALAENPEFPCRSPIGVRDPDGRFVLEDVAARTWGLVVSGPGTTPSTVTGIELAAGADVDIGEIQLARGRRLTGYVQDARGARIAGARVTIGTESDREDRDPLRAWLTGDAETVTGADGTFVVDGVFSRRGATAVAISASHAAQGVAISRAPLDGDAPVALTLVETGAIAGVVLDFSGGYASIFARHRGEGRTAGIARLGPTGTFTVTGLPPGDYEVEMIRGPRKPVAPPVTVTVVANQRATVRMAMPRAD